MIYPSFPWFSKYVCLYGAQVVYPLNSFLYVWTFSEFVFTSFSCVFCFQTLQPCRDTGSNSAMLISEPASCSLSRSDLSEDPLDCDWSEHICPDGCKYYFNSATCESRVMFQFLGFISLFQLWSCSCLFNFSKNFVVGKAGGVCLLWTTVTEEAVAKSFLSRHPCLNFGGCIYRRRLSNPSRREAEGTPVGNVMCGG